MRGVIQFLTCKIPYMYFYGIFRCFSWRGIICLPRFHQLGNFHAYLFHFPCLCGRCHLSLGLWRRCLRAWYVTLFKSVLEIKIFVHLKWETVGCIEIVYTFCWKSFLDNILSVSFRTVTNLNFSGFYCFEYFESIMFETTNWQNCE